MSHACAFGPIAGPQAAKKSEPDATHFRVRDVWQSPAGHVYKVVERELSFGRIRVRLMDVTSKRKVWRSWDAIGAHSNRCWVRLSWGGAE